MINIFRFKKRKIDTTSVDSFNKAIKTIDWIVASWDYNKALKAAKEIKVKENESFKDFIENLKEKEKKNEIKKFKKRILYIEKLIEKIETKKRIYAKNLKKKEEKLEQNQIDKTINDLIWQKKFIEAGSVLNNYFEKNESNYNIIDFINKKKKEIKKAIEKHKKEEKKEIQNNVLLEAKELVWDIKSEIKSDQTFRNFSFFKNLKNKLNLKKKYKEKKLIDEVSLLIQNNNNKNDFLARSKLEKAHSWLSKEIFWEKINWYELYGKIIWADKISWDALWYVETKNDYKFFIWDATWHGIRAWLIISNLTKKFNEISKSKPIENVVFEVNNVLKQDLKSWNFVTSIFFSIDKKNHSIIKIIWMWHEPIFIYRKETKTIEKVIPWWLAAWIRLIKDISQVKHKDIILQDWDILISYTDWLTESRNESGEMYSIERVGEKLLDIARNNKASIQDIYDFIKNDLKQFTWWKLNYNDDVSILIIKRDKNKNIIKNKEDIEEIIVKEWIYKNYKNKLKWKTYEEIQNEITQYKNKNEIKNIIKNLDSLYKAWEITKLKHDSIRYIKEWYIHKKINFYLKKSLENENVFKIKQKNKKIQDKYNVLKELYKKWDYDTVIQECSNIISKDWNI